MKDALMDFFLPRELGRLSYFWRALLFNSSIYYLSGNGTAWMSGRMNADAWGALGLTVYFIFFIIRPRMRDSHMSGWTLVLAFIPYLSYLFSLLLLLRPSWNPLDTPSRASREKPPEIPHADSQPDHMPG